MNKRHACTIKRLRTGLDAKGQRPAQDPSQDTDVATEVPYAREPLRGLELEQARQVDPRMSERVTLYTQPDWNLTTDDYLVDAETGDVLNIGGIIYPDGIRVEATMLVGRSA